METSQGKRILYEARCLLALLPMIYVLTLMWWIPEGAKYVPGLTLFSLLFYPLLGGRFEREKELLDKQRPLLFGLWGVVLTGGLVYALKGSSWSELRAFLAAALYLTVFRGVRVPRMSLLAVLVISAIGFAVHGYYQYSHGVFRVHGFINPIPYATAVGALSLVCLALAVFGRVPAWQRVVFTLAGLATAVTVMMTRTRGVIIPFIIIVCGVFAVHYLLTHRGKVSRSLVVSLLLVSGLAVFAGSMMEGRIQQTMNEYESIVDGNYGGSIGVRLQLWLSAQHLVADAPVIGHGSDYREALEQLYEEGKIEVGLYRFGANHFHNQYVDALVKKGVLGLVALLLLLLATVRLAWASPSGDWRRYGGLVITLMFATAALTDVPLVHAETIFLFLTLTIAIGAVADRKERGDRSGVITLS
ncbi:O-antigen ligase family protein [Marinobacter mobilis]|uniref:O-antigen ligase n=1 Tax=Marinobacter mobilis TaxID=488533 RepID=A0A1H3AZE4_9GAMM|nr:O-antigen ligase family protein [Marinobacter mobilis]SDX34179.1 O-antigen ligase [Marinobacter mobilis]